MSRRETDRIAKFSYFGWKLLPRPLPLKPEAGAPGEPPETSTSGVITRWLMLLKNHVEQMDQPSFMEKICVLWYWLIHSGHSRQKNGNVTLTSGHGEPPSSPFRMMVLLPKKCNACNKTVYLVDKLTADNRVYHKSCFRCHHCRGTLKLSNFNSFEGVLYCRPHFDQLFKRTGSLDKSFEGMPKIVKPERAADNVIPSSKNVSNLFAGTRDKCADCDKTVYPIEKVTVEGTAYHRGCFKCTYGGCTISPSSYIAHEGKLYCKHHHIQLFKEKGNYSQLENEKTLEVAKATFPMEVVAES